MSLFFSNLMTKVRCNCMEFRKQSIFYKLIMTVKIVLFVDKPLSEKCYDCFFNCCFITTRKTQLGTILKTVPQFRAWNKTLMKLAKGWCLIPHGINIQSANEIYTKSLNYLLNRFVYGVIRGYKP